MQTLSDIAAHVLQHHQRSTSDLIADALREAILRGIFRAGKPLRQDEIAKEFGVSRIPVREAMRQLEAEGLLTFSPNRGATVSILSSTDVQEIYEIRVALETMALEFAIPKLEGVDFDRAHELIATNETVSDVARWAELNWEFHATLYAPANRPRLLSLIQTLHVNVDRYIRLQLQEMNYLARSQKEHVLLLEACQNRDVATATQILRDHIIIAGVELVHYLQQSQSV
jgi:DNA-binding GntR family transcriptional regulator